MGLLRGLNIKEFLNKTVELKYYTLIIFLSLFIISVVSLLMIDGSSLKSTREIKKDGGPVKIAENELPTFHQYAATWGDGYSALGDSYDGKIAEVDLNSHPDARMFRTALWEGVKNGPNFAFYYTIVMWGCGSECHDFAIVDVRDGKVYFPDFGFRWGLEFVEYSNLLIADPYDIESDHFGYPARYYVWENNNLRLIREANIVCGVEN